MAKTSSEETSIGVTAFKSQCLGLIDDAAKAASLTPGNASNMSNHTLMPTILIGSTTLPAVLQTIRQIGSLPQPEEFLVIN